MINEDVLKDCEEYSVYYINGEPPAPCANHEIIIITQFDDNIIYGCKSCGIRYIVIGVWT